MKTGRGHLRRSYVIPLLVSCMAGWTIGASAATLSVSPGVVSMPVGTHLQFAAISNSGGIDYDVTAFANWESSDENIATVSNAPGTRGQVTIVQADPAPVQISATVLSQVALSSVTATSDLALLSISVSPSDGYIPSGASIPYTATGHFNDSSTSDLTTSVTWSTSAPSQASVSNDPGTQGLVTGLQAGPSPMSVIATSGAIVGEGLVTVTPPPMVSIEVVPATATVQVFATKSFTLTAHYGDGSTSEIGSAAVWTSSAPLVARVSSETPWKGLALGVQPSGLPAQILATYNSFVDHANLMVTNENVDVPDGDFGNDVLGPAIGLVRSSPTAGAFEVWFSLPSAQPARLELVDVAGRRLLAREVGAAGRGRHVLSWSETAELPAGIYWLQLRQAEEQSAVRAVKLR
jgi:hypothetical protein